MEELHTLGTCLGEALRKTSFSSSARKCSAAYSAHGESGSCECTIARAQEKNGRNYKEIQQTKTIS